MTARRKATDDADFDAFVARVEPRLRTALVATYGPADGRVWLLYTETTPAACTSSPCTMTVNIAPVDDITDVHVIATFDDAAEIGANTRLTLSTKGNILGVIERAAPALF